uniref:Uncharacterized protein n=1 Tax=Fagus sylvatica TaxID=28930 RepID=A0A2N9GU15_FAGSY
MFVDVPSTRRRGPRLLALAEAESASSLGDFLLQANLNLWRSGAFGGSSAVIWIGAGVLFLPAWVWEAPLASGICVGQRSEEGREGLPV